MSEQIDYIKTKIKRRNIKTVISALTTGTSGSSTAVSTRIFFTSIEGAVDDADVEYGSSTFGTDNYDTLQALLDEAANGPILIIWDGHYSTSNQLLVRGNTHIIGLPRCGLILRSQANGGVGSPLMANYNQVLSSSSGGYGSNIVDENILIENLILNGNGENQVGTVGNYEAMKFVGVRNLQFHGCEFLESRVFQFVIENTEYLRFRDCIIDLGPNRTTLNNDGIHVYGYAKNPVIEDCKVLNTNDDAVVFMTSEDDVRVDRGPILNPVVRNLYGQFDRAGVRFAIGNTGYDITDGLVDGVYGTFRRTYGFRLSQWPTTTSGGIIKNLTVKNFQLHCVGTSAVADSYIRISNGTYENIVFENLNRREYTTAIPYFLMENGTFDNLTIRGFAGKTTVSTFADAFFQMDNGTIQNLTVNDYYYRTTGTASYNPIVETNGGATIARLRMNNITTLNTTRILNINAGTVANIAINGLTAGGVTNVFYTNTTITYLYLTNYVAGTVFWNTLFGGSGGITNKLGSTFDYMGPTTYANRPTASLYPGAEIYVTDEADGATRAFSDGTNWISNKDGAAVTGP